MEESLQEKIEKKLDWAKTEREKGLQVIEKQLHQLKENKEILLKLETIISLLEELLSTKKEE